MTKINYHFECKRYLQAAKKICASFHKMFFQQPFGYYLVDQQVDVWLMTRTGFRRELGSAFYNCDGCAEYLQDGQCNIYLVVSDNEKYCLCVLAHEALHLCVFCDGSTAGHSINQNLAINDTTYYDDRFVSTAQIQMLMAEYNEKMDSKYSKCTSEWLPEAIEHYLWDASWRDAHPCTTKFFNDKGFYAYD